MTHRAAIVGSTVFPLTTVTGGEVVDTIRALQPGSVILTRGGKGFDEFVRHVCLVLGIRCFAYPGHGRDNWERDQELVTDADEVIAFLAPNSLDDPHTGTAHVIDVALKAGKPVRAATAYADRLYWVESGVVESASS